MEDSKIIKLFYERSEQAITVSLLNDGSVFEVISMETVSVTGDEITFSVCVSKGGVMQEPFSIPS